MPLLSIVIANYNYGRFLPEAIESILAQNVGDHVEVIICDAASTDDSVDVIKRYAGGLPPGVERESFKVEELNGWKGEGVDYSVRRAMAEKKVAEWLAGVDEHSLDVALQKLVDEKSAAGEYRFKKPGERELAISGARRFFREFSRKIIPLSDGRCVYFAPDPRAKLRNANNSLSWAEYAFHAVSSGGNRIPGKNYNYRNYNEYKVVNTDLIEDTLIAERCVPVLKNKSTEDVVKFFGSAYLGGLLDVVVRLDECGNVNANMTEVTFEASTKRRQKKPPQLVSLAEAVRTVVSHQTATGTYPPNTDIIANSADSRKGGGEKCLNVGIEECLNNGNSTVHLHLSPSPITYWCSEKDRGQSHAFNKGFSHAHGRFLTWLNADDVLLPGTVAKLKAAASRHPECEWFVGGCFWLDKQMRILKCFRARSFSEIRFRTGQVSSWGPSSFFTKRILDLVGGVDERCKYTMDGDLWLKFAAIAKVRYLPFTHYAWGLRLHEDAKMSAHNFASSGESDPTHPKWAQIRYEGKIRQEYFTPTAVRTRLNWFRSIRWWAVLMSRLDTCQYCGRNYLEYYQ